MNGPRPLSDGWQLAFYAMLFAIGVLIGMALL